MSKRTKLDQLGWINTVKELLEVEIDHDTPSFSDVGARLPNGIASRALVVGRLSRGVLRGAIHGRRGSRERRATHTAVPGVAGRGGYWHCGTRWLLALRHVMATGIAARGGHWHCGTWY